MYSTPSSLKAAVRLFSTSLAIGATLQATEKNSTQKPNIIIINIDNLSQSQLGYNNNLFVETPNINKLADSSTVFSNFHVASRCAPSRSALLMGRYSLRSGCIGTGDARTRAKTGIPTIGNYFHSAGWKTGAFGKWHIGSIYPYRAEDRGFDEVVNSLQSYPQIQSLEGNIKNAEKNIFRHNGVWQKYEGFRSDVFFQEMIKFIKKCTAQKQHFLAYLATHSVHHPNGGPEQFAKYFAKKLANKWPNFKADPKKVHNIIHMAAEMKSIDNGVGLLLKTLDELNIRNNTLLIFTSDGPGGNEPKTFVDTKKLPKSVPFILSWPGEKLDTDRVDTVIANIDVLPTLLDICKIQPDQEYPLDGQSFYGLIKKGKTPWKPRFYIQDHQSLHNDRQVIYRKMDSATVWFPDGSKVEFKEGKAVTGNLPPEKIKTAESVYETWWKSVTAESPKYNYTLVDGTVNPYYDETEYIIQDGPAGKGTKRYHPVEFAETGIYTFSDIYDDPARGITYSVKNPQPSKRKGNLWIDNICSTGTFPITLKVQKGKHLIMFDLHNDGKGSKTLRIEQRQLRGK
jgi:arylsulfatase A-like enzyme